MIGLLPSSLSRDYIFGILENYHYWRFNGSGAIEAIEIVRLIFFCTRLHYEYFFKLWMCFRDFIFDSKIPKIYH